MDGAGVVTHCMVKRSTVVSYSRVELIAAHRVRVSGRGHAAPCFSVIVVRAWFSRLIKKDSAQITSTSHQPRRQFQSCWYHIRAACEMHHIAKPAAETIHQASSLTYFHPISGIDLKLRIH